MCSLSAWFKPRHKPESTRKVKPCQDKVQRHLASEAEKDKYSAMLLECHKEI